MITAGFRLVCVPVKAPFKDCPDGLVAVIAILEGTAAGVVKPLLDYACSKAQHTLARTVSLFRVLPGI